MRFPTSSQWAQSVLHCKKRLAIFPSPAGMSPNILYLAGRDVRNQTLPGRE